MNTTSASFPVADRTVSAGSNAKSPHAEVHSLRRPAVLSATFVANATHRAQVSCMADNVDEMGGMGSMGMGGYTSGDMGGNMSGDFGGNMVRRRRGHRHARRLRTTIGALEAGAQAALQLLPAEP